MKTEGLVFHDSLTYILHHTDFVKTVLTPKRKTFESGIYIYVNVTLYKKAKSVLWGTRKKN